MRKFMQHGFQRPEIGQRDVILRVVNHDNTVPPLIAFVVKLRRARSKVREAAVFPACRRLRPVHHPELLLRDERMRVRRKDLLRQINVLFQPNQRSASQRRVLFQKLSFDDERAVVDRDIFILPRRIPKIRLVLLIVPRRFLSQHE